MISTEVVRRELHYFVDNYGKNADVTNLVNTRELWFMPVSNPDGYQYTFDSERLWRKNLRDNDGDGQITNADGVDLNRNYDINWGYDDEGSSSQISSETFRGTRPASEPEVQAHQGLIDRLKFKFLVTYHSYGPLLLYPFGWQIETPSADDPLYVAYTGTDAKPAVTRTDPNGLEFDPGVAADLYTTNGTTDDYSYSKTGALSWTPELEEGWASPALRSATSSAATRRPVRSTERSTPSSTPDAWNAGTSAREAQAGQRSSGAPSAPHRPPERARARAIRRCHAAA